MPYCSICQQTVPNWLAHPLQHERSPLMTLLDTVGSDLSVYGCPACHCNDRLRHLWLYMLAAGVAERLAGASVLHIAPEPHLERLIAGLQPAQYIRGDLHPTRADHHRLDIEALPFEEGSFDIILCNHVLEHVHHPETALAELHRCLKAGGLLIAQTPYAPSIKKTLELHTPPSPDTARLLFGQDDHVRLFGSDIASYFHAAGFKGAPLAHETLLSDADCQDFGCNPKEPFFVFWKEQSGHSRPRETAAADARPALRAQADAPA